MIVYILHLNVKINDANFEVYLTKTGWNIMHGKLIIVYKIKRWERQFLWSYWQFLRSYWQFYNCWQFLFSCWQFPLNFCYFFSVIDSFFSQLLAVFTHLLPFLFSIIIGFLCKFLTQLIQYNTVEPNLMGSAVLLRFRDGFGFKKAKIKKRKIWNSIYLSVHPIDSV